MESIDTSKIISMTELQKLSLKRLRRMKVPLFVLDRKSKKGGFVILDLKTFKQFEAEGVLPGPFSTLAPGDPPRKKFLTAYDFRAQGLFWDRPEINNKSFLAFLKNPDHAEYRWAASRVLERLPSEEVLRLFPLSTIETMLQKAPLRETFRRPWEHAIQYWRQKAPRPG